MNDRMTQTIIVRATAEEVFRVWENFENFPRFMQNIKKVTKTGLRTSHWVMEGPLGKDLEWDAEMTLHEPYTRIAWATTQGDVQNSGQVTFTDLQNGQTQITVLMQYVPPVGLAGEIVGKLFGNPDKKLEEDLRNFKQFIEGMHDRTAAAS